MTASETVRFAESRPSALGVAEYLWFAVSFAREQTVKIIDETPGSTASNSFTLENLKERMSLREIIRARIYQEVLDFNRSQDGVFRGLVQPTDAEKTLNGYRLKQQRQVDWERQYELALEAFARNGFFVLVDNRQAENLDEVFEIGVETEVSFIKLTPLVGG